MIPQAASGFLEDPCMSRAAIVGASWAVLLALLVSIGVRARADDDPSAVFSKAFKLVQDDATISNLEVLPDYLGGDGWPTAVAILQDILDADEDVFLPVSRPGPDGKDITVWTGARAEALRIVASMPPPGRAAYHAAADAPAKTMLTSARTKGDWRLVREVARRYPLTPAGLEAAKLLGMHHLDRGDAGQAARWFLLWQQRNAKWEMDGVGIYLAWAALLRSGQTAQADAFWQKLELRHAGGLKLGDRKVSLAELKKPWQSAKADSVPGANAPGSGSGSGSWSTFAGSPTRNGVAGQWPAALALQWSTATSPSQTTNALLDIAMSRQEERPQPVLSGSFPIVAGDKIVCRTQGGIQAFSQTTGKVVWDRPSELSLEALLNDASRATVIEYWLNAYLNYHPQVVLENSNIGCLSADQARVYAVDDLPVIPYVSRIAGKKYAVQAPYDAFVANAVQHSRLCAVDAATGKLAWEVGRQPDGDPFLNDCCFLGPPLAVEGRLYGVAENRGYLYLYCLDSAVGKLLWKQCLGSPQYGLTLDGGRRLQAVHVSYDQGILVCPTNAGAVIAYDLHTGSLLWAHAYRNKIVQPAAKLKGLRSAKELEIETMPNLRNQLQISAPVIWQGKVVVASPDSPVVECVRLSDGAVLWKVERTPDDLFLAGVQQDKVLLVGRKECRALSVADGKELWKTEVGLPSGQGVFTGDGYVLPIKTDGQAKTAAVVRLHLQTGEAKRLADLPGQSAAGNLLVVNDQLISQTVTTVAGWGRAKARRI
jgi:outer membrane protein assembly factor BamB